MPKVTWDVDPILLTLGTYQLRWYTAMFISMVWAGGALVWWQIVRGGGTHKDGMDFIPYGVVGAVVGSRLGHVLFYDLDKALADPLWVFKYWEGGLASHGGVIGVALAMYAFTKRRGIAFIEGADRSVYGGTMAATLVRIGNLFNSEIVGRRTDQSWGMQFPRYWPDPIGYRYPTQVFEIAMGVVIMIALFIFDHKIGKERRPRGAMISFWFTLYFALRFLVEFTKEPMVFRDGPLDMGHYLSIPGFVLGVVGLYWSFKRRVPAGWYKQSDGPPHRSLAEHAS